MLQYQLLKNHAGITLIGDYLSLRSLHEVIHDINERSPLIKDKEGDFLGFAYEIRKAFERQREIIERVEGYPEIGVRYGAGIIWPALLIHSRILRESLAFIPHSYKHQAAIYALEAIIDEALKEDLNTLAIEAHSLWLRINPLNPSVFDMLGSRGGYFCSLSKAARKQQFLNLLRSFDPMYDTYYAMRVKNGEKGLISPTDFVMWQGREWPNPKW